MCDDFSNMTITIEEAKIIYQGKEWYVLVDLSNTHIPIPKMFSIKCRPFLVTHGIKLISFFTLDQFSLWQAQNGANLFGISWTNKTKSWLRFF